MEIVVIAHDMRSTHNVGSLLRTAEGLGVQHVYLTGYTPYPKVDGDSRLPHLANKITRQIEKTALGATDTLAWSHNTNIHGLIAQLKADGYTIVALEQTNTATKLHDYTPPDKVALLLGREVEGIDLTLLKLCDDVVEIPMLGQKESLNVVQAAAIAIFYIQYRPKK